MHQNDLLDSINADIEVLTEPGQPHNLLRDGKAIVASETRRSDGESWVVIRGHSVAPCAFEIPFERMATAATATVHGTDFLVYGSVLPWLAAASHAPDVFDLPRKGIPSAAIYGAWLTAQLRDIWNLGKIYPKHRLLWLGDFNVPIRPPFQQHLPAGSDMVIDALHNLGLRAFNGDAPHRSPEVQAVDLICGPNSMVVTASECTAGSAQGLRLSDHLLYYVDVELASHSTS
jgi:hypothetical protein